MFVMFKQIFTHSTHLPREIQRIGYKVNIKDTDTQLLQRTKDHQQSIDAKKYRTYRNVSIDCGMGLNFV